MALKDFKKVLELNDNVEHGRSLEGNIRFWQIALRLEVWGYTNKVRLRGLPETREGGFSLYSRDFQSPGVFSKSGCSRLEPVLQVLCNWGEEHLRYIQ